MKSYRAFLIAAMGLILLQDPANGATLKFDGKELRSEETGFTALPGKDKWVALTSIYHHYSLVLPAVEPWEFETSKEIPLRGSSERFEVSLEIVPKGDQRSAKKKLTSILERVQASSDLDVRNVSYPKFQDQLALRYEVRFKAAPESVESLNQWQYTYWTVIPRGDLWYVLHFTPPPPPAPNEDQIPRVVDLVFRAGFRADFEVK